MSLIRFEDYFTISEAVEFLKEKGITITGQTLRNWGRKYDFAEKKGGALYIKKTKLKLLIEHNFNFDEMGDE